MWNSFKTDAPGGITATTIQFAGANGDQIHAYVARPEGGGRHP